MCTVGDGSLISQSDGTSGGLLYDAIFDDGKSKHCTLLPFCLPFVENYVSHKPFVARRLLLEMLFPWSSDLPFPRDLSSTGFSAFKSDFTFWIFGFWSKLAITAVRMFCTVNLWYTSIVQYQSNLYKKNAFQSLYLLDSEAFKFSFSSWYVAALSTFQTGTLWQYRILLYY